MVLLDQNGATALGYIGAFLHCILTVLPVVFSCPEQPQLLTMRSVSGCNVLMRHTILLEKNIFSYQPHFPDDEYYYWTEIRGERI